MPMGVGFQMLKDRWGKATLRGFIDTHVPDSVINYPKQGFSFDVSDLAQLDNVVETMQNGYWIKTDYGVIGRNCSELHIPTN